MSAPAGRDLLVDDGPDGKRVWLLRHGDGLWCSLACALKGHSRDEVTPKPFTWPVSTVAVLAMWRLTCDSCGKNISDLFRTMARSALVARE